jgi:hypothetical protein
MPLTSKGNKILAHMKEQYGPEKGESVFYASRNKGTITGVDSDTVPAHPIHGYMDAVSRGDSEGMKKALK